MPESLTQEAEELLVYNAICAIAAVCDGAISQDGVGFNGSDTKFGRRIATVAFEDWTADIRNEAARILGNTYRVQAQTLTGIDARELQVVRDAAEVYTNHAARDQARQIERARNAASERFITKAGSALKFVFPFDAKLKDELKSYGAKWDGGGKAWWITTDQVNSNIVGFAITNGFSYNDEVDTILEAGATVTAPDPLKNGFQIQGDHLIVTLVAKLGGSSFDEYRSLDGYSWIRGSQESTVDATSRNLAWLSSHGFAGDYSAFGALIDNREVSLSAEEAAQAARIEASKAASTTTDYSAFCPAGLALDDYQAAGVEYALEVGSTFIADEMGLGKTIQAIVAVKASGSYPALVVCPASLKGNWAKEIAKWDPERSVQVLSGRTPSRTTTDWIVVNYDIVDGWADVLIDRHPEALVCDESHYIKNPTAKRTKAITKIAQAA